MNGIAGKTRKGCAWYSPDTDRCERANPICQQPKPMNAMDVQARVETTDCSAYPMASTIE